MLPPFMARDLSIQTLMVSPYWSENEVQLYLTRFMMRATVAGLFRVKASNVTFCIIHRKTILHAYKMATEKNLRNFPAGHDILKGLPIE